MVKFYRALTRILHPFISLYLWKRKLAGKEDPKRFSERLGIASIPRPEGKLVWVHAASVGESLSVLPLVSGILNYNPKLHVLVTTGTVTSANMLAPKLPRKAMHQYVPVDRLNSVKRFLDHWKPDLALWTESELWPNLVTETHAAGCPMIQVNACISARSYAKWQRFGDMSKTLLNCFALTLAQTGQDAKRFADLGAQQVEVLGNLKYDAPPLAVEPNAFGQMMRAVQGRKLWAAASTHPGEEAIAAEVHRALKGQYPNLLTVIIPRHPHRGKEIAESLGMKYALRSRADKVTPDTEIYIADTLGELGLFYRLCDIVFIGGSLNASGGHNPLEAARCECAIISGPHVRSFAEIYGELGQADAYIAVRDAEQLASTVRKLLEDSEKREALSEQAYQLVQEKTGVLNLYMRKLEPFLKAL